MFSQKKKFPWVWIVIILLVGVIGVLVLVSAISETKADSKSNTYQIEEDSNVSDSKSSDTDDEAGNHNEDPMEGVKNANSDDLNQAYYLVKNDKNIIKIFYVDSTGKENFLENTEILYEVLSKEDQKRFDEGIKLENRDSLARLIMDYES